MATEVFFISEEKIKSFTDVNENVYVSDLIPGLISSQDLDLQNLLGSKFYDGLKARILANTLSVDETNLINEFIAPFLLNQAVWRILPNIKWKLLNKSVLSPSSETANTISLEEFQYLRNDQLNTATFYAERLRNHLVQYNYLYPEYVSPDFKGIVPDRNEQASSQFSMPSTNTYGPMIYGRRTNWCYEDYPVVYPVGGGL
jgi:hypothetical protein